MHASRGIIQSGVFEKSDRPVDIHSISPIDARCPKHVTRNRQRDTTMAFNPR